MGETYVTLAKLPAYYQHLDLAQNFDVLNAEFERRRAAADRREDARDAARRRRRRSGSARTTTTRGSQRAGPTATSASARAALFLLLTLPGDAILYQGDEIALEDGKVPDDRVLDLADPPRDPERTPLPWTRSGDEWRSRGCRSQTRSATSRTSAPIPAARSTTSAT